MSDATGESSREKWDENLPLGRWLEAIAAPQPLPAGGRVAAITLALASSLVEKIARIVLRSARRAPLHPLAEDVASRAASLRPLILGVGEADDRAYAAILAVRRGDHSEAASVQEAELRAARLQLRLIEYCVEVAALAARMEPGVGSAMGADLVTARHLAVAAARGARGNLEADLASQGQGEGAALLRDAAAAAMERLVTLPG